MLFYGGIDLHSSNSYICVIDDNDKRVFDRRLPNQLEQILMAFSPFKDNLKGIVVESTYNWYWLVDGLQEHQYSIKLANPAAIKQYEGLKFTDDSSDAFWLAHMLRLNILPQGYIYPKEDRGLRDLLRRRSMFVGQHTAQLLSLQSMIIRNTGIKMSGNAVSRLNIEDTQEMFSSPHLALMAQNNLESMVFLKSIIKRIETTVLAEAKLRKEFQLLLDIPGIGKILALTIMMEVGDISRFRNAGAYSSYCRCVQSRRETNGKKKGENNRKNGNKYLSWAYIEAANFMRRYCLSAQKFYQRKEAKANSILATKALSNKIAKASYYVIRDQVPFDVEKLFK